MAYDWKTENIVEKEKGEAEGGEEVQAEPVQSFRCPHCGKEIAYEPVADAEEEHEGEVE